MENETPTSQMPPQLPNFQPASPRKKSRSCLWIVLILLIAGFGLAVFSVLCLGCIQFLDEFENGSCNIIETTVEDGSEDKIVIIPIEGVIARQASKDTISTEEVLDYLDAIRDDSAVKAIILDMDTPGGEVIAADEIHHAILKLKKELSIPVVTCMHSMCASGGYYIAAATDYLIANRMTMTGSIGVIMSSFNVSKLMDKIGVSAENYTSGDMKDMLSPTRPRTKKETEYINAMIQETFREFAQIVADGRPAAFKSVEDVLKSEFADGRVVSGAQALKLGLVDELGGEEEAIAKAKELAQLRNPTIVRYSYQGSLFDELFSLKSSMHPSARDILPTKTVQVQAGQLYLLPPHLLAH